MRTIYAYIALTIYLFTVAAVKRFQVEKLFKAGKLEEAKTFIETYVRSWGKFVIGLTKSEIEVIGKENLPEGNCLFVANHQSNFDIPVMLGYIDKSMGFIAKKELEKIPMISYWMRRIDCIFMDRSDIRKSVKSINEGVEKLKSGSSMVIFPEGTRSKGEEIHEFKKGSMKLATKSGVPVVPVVIDGTYKIKEGNEGSWIKPAKARIIICKPINVADYNKEEQGELASIIRDIIIEERAKHN